MHPKLVEITDYLAKVRGDLTRTVEQTPRAAMDRDPGGGKWSGAGIIQHLGKVEGAATKMLEGLFAGALASGMPDEKGTDSLLHSLDNYKIPDRTTLIAAPERLHPEPTAELDASWASLLAVRERLHLALATVDGKDLSVVSYPHPIVGPLTGYEWVLIIGKHEERHLAQLRETTRPMA